MFSTTRFPISHYWYTLFASTQYVSTMTRCPPLANCAIDNLHVLMVVFVLPYRPLDAQLDPGIRASRHWSRCCWRSARRYKNHLYVGLLAVPGLRLVRNILRRRTRGRRSDLRLPRRHRWRRVIGYSRVSTRTRVPWNRRAGFWERIVWTKMWNCWEILSYRSQNCSSISRGSSGMIVRRILVESEIDVVKSTRNSYSPQSSTLRPFW